METSYFKKYEELQKKYSQLILELKTMEERLQSKDNLIQALEALQNTKIA